MNLKLFFKASAFDYLLVLVAATTLTMTISFGFESAPGLRGNPAICAGVAAPLLLVLFAGSWSKRALVPAGFGALVYMLAVVAGLSSLSTAAIFDGGTVNDVAESTFSFAVVAVVVPLLSYLLSRRRAGVFVMLLVSIVSCEFVQFLYRDWMSNGGAVISLVAIASVMALFVYQAYRSSVYAAQRVRGTSFAQAAAFSCGLSALCVLVGVAFFFLIVSPLGVQTPQIKPFKDYFQRPVVEYAGNYKRKPVDDPSQKSSELSKNKSTTRNNTLGGSQGKSADNKQENNQDQQQNAGSKKSYDQSSWDQAFQAISYEQLVLGILVLIALFVAFLVFVVLMWKRRRKRRLERIALKKDAYQVWWIYAFLVGRMERLGCKRASNLTLMEYAMATRDELEYLFTDAKLDFLGMTLVYQRAAYGQGTVTPEELDAFKDCYWAFYRNAYRHTAKLKWAFWYFWRL